MGDLLRNIAFGDYNHHKREFLILQRDRGTYSYMGDSTTTFVRKWISYAAGNLSEALF